ncbi:MAG: ATP synthase subunit I [Flavitalea sp.]
MHVCLLYVDPGSGGYLIQMIIAGILGALFYFKGLWWKIKSFFVKKKPGNTDKENGNI